MKPIDFRDATFEQLAGYIADQREAVYKAWGAHGPCTTKQLAERSGLNVLNVRPRTNELVLLGFMRLAKDALQTVAGEGVYRTTTEAELAAWFAAMQHAARNPQQELPLRL